jgi:hypothetical protein
MSRPARVLDASALVALFAGAPKVIDLLEQADAGRVTLGLPTTCIAGAQGSVRSRNGWDAILLTSQVLALPFGEQAAVEIGLWPGPLEVRHAVHEARAIGATVVTCRPEDYIDMNVPLLVV